MPIELSIPKLKTPIGLGDLIKGATKVIGIKPCGGCKQRQEMLNRAVKLVPRESKNVNISSK